MDLLLDPNVLYLLLVVGFLLAVLALFAPGTGLLELGAVAGLVVAGYGIARLPVNAWALVVLVLGVFPFLIAVRRSGRWPFLLVAMLALAIGSAYLIRGAAWWQPGVQPLLALLVSAASTGLLWLVGYKGLEAINRQSTTVLDRLTGAIGRAETEISTEGSAYVAGESWSAHSRVPIPARAPLRVVRRDGFTLEVEEISK